MGSDCRAHITGTVWKVLVAVGEAVQAEQEVVILESMKMELPVVASGTGRVAAIHVQEGQAVTEGDRLVTIE
jgi:acetyl-CoA carboxylase biotin carboxyl carrier protein